MLYDEPHPLGDDIGDLQTYDLGRNPDMLLIMGTSLKVHGLKRVVKEFAKVVHNRKGGLVVFVNATPPSKEWEGIIDVHVHGETDKWVNRVNDEWKHLRPADWEQQPTIDNTFAVVGKPSTSAISEKAGEKPVKPKGEFCHTLVVYISWRAADVPVLAAPKRPTKAKPKDAKPQLPPTPPPSQPSISAPSPTSSLSSAPPTEDSELTDIPSSPESLPLDPDPIEALPTAPPTPISPSKRHFSASFSSSCIDRISRSPMKKTKSFPIVTPGRGNLFNPRPINSQTATVPDGFDVDFDFDFDVFGSPTKAQTGQKHTVSAPETRRTRTRTRTRTGDKENILVPAISATATTTTKAPPVLRASKRLVVI